MLKKLGLRTVATIAAIANLAGCSQGTVAHEEEAVGTRPQPLAEIKSANGEQLILVGEAKSVVVKSARELKLNADEPPGELTSNEDQLAEELRAVVLSDGYEYRGGPARELARKVLADRSKAGGLGSASSEAGSSESDREGRVVFGSDGRTYQSSNTSFPYRTFVWSEVECTGTMIGPGTMVTAAHCVYDTVNDAWLKVWDPTSGPSGADRYPRYSPGVDGRDATQAPYGWQQCYDVAIPGGYSSATSDTSSAAQLYDYAVLDFTTRCGVRPGDATGWMGTWLYSEASIESLTTYIYGYPQYALDVYRYTGSVPNHFAEIWGMSGAAGTTYIDSPTTTLRTTIDTYGGQSGSAYWVNDTDRRVIGIHHGGNSSYNVARRFDADVYNFWDAYSPYPQQL